MENPSKCTHNSILYDLPPTTHSLQINLGMMPTFNSTKTSSHKSGARRGRSVTIHTIECGAQGRRLVKTHVENRRKSYVDDDTYECYIPSGKKRQRSLTNMLFGVRWFHRNSCSGQQTPDEKSWPQISPSLKLALDSCQYASMDVGHTKITLLQNSRFAHRIDSTPIRNS